MIVSIQHKTQGSGNTTHVSTQRPAMMLTPFLQLILGQTTDENLLHFRVGSFLIHGSVLATRYLAPGVNDSTALYTSRSSSDSPERNTS